MVWYPVRSQRYYIDPAFARTGLPDFYLDILKSSCKEGRLTFYRERKSSTRGSTCSTDDARATPLGLRREPTGLRTADPIWLTPGLLEDEGVRTAPPAPVTPISNIPPSLP